MQEFNSSINMIFKNPKNILINNSICPGAQIFTYLSVIKPSKVEDLTEAAS
jgi:hypothetical protein